MKAFPRGKGQAGRQQLTRDHCHSFLSPLTCAVRSVYRTVEHQGLLQAPTSNLHGQCPLAGVQAEKSMNDCNTYLIPLTFHSH